MKTATATIHQRIVTTFNEHPGKVFRVRDPHEHLGLPTDEPSINVTRSRPGRPPPASKASSRTQTQFGGQ
ncbi:hypothetical protein [Streptomyces sp. ML-6]|uniref:hypothetical protein n=1 Tax=Streptomyces sp. ML-6 TaxID=2982693 RepID=UPI0024BF2F51|nr:hypothetical protein [Streptomyces sp. ML-6]MDK0523572.1 hypothetical protein [Streptomyces sp. ML-6]